MFAVKAFFMEKRLKMGTALAAFLIELNKTSLPFYRAWGFGGYIINDAVNTPDIINDPV